MVLEGKPEPASPEPPVLHLQNCFLGLESYSWTTGASPQCYQLCPLLRPHSVAGCLYISSWLPGPTSWDSHVEVTSKAHSELLEDRHTIVRQEVMSKAAQGLAQYDVLTHVYNMNLPSCRPSPKFIIKIRAAVEWLKLQYVQGLGIYITIYSRMIRMRD